MDFLVSAVTDFMFILHQLPMARIFSSRDQSAATILISQPYPLCFTNFCSKKAIKAIWHIS